MIGRLEWYAPSNTRERPGSYSAKRSLGAPQAPIGTGSVSDLVGHSLPRTLSYVRPPLAGTTGIAGSPAEQLCWGAVPARNERFSAKTGSSDSTQRNAINSMRLLTGGFFAPIGAHCGRDARAPRALRVLALTSNIQHLTSVLSTFSLTLRPIWHKKLVSKKTPAFLKKRSVQFRTWTCN
jgi:hypothetical protein